VNRNFLDPAASSYYDPHLAGQGTCWHIFDAKTFKIIGHNFWQRCGKVAVGRLEVQKVEVLQLIACSCKKQTYNDPNLGPLDYWIHIGCKAPSESQLGFLLAHDVVA
jgi:hypothetical protein